MNERIDIVVPEAELERNAEKAGRLEKTRNFQPADRVPVLMIADQFTVLDYRKSTIGDYLRDAKSNLREQILNLKWRVEHIRDDQPIPTESLTFEPDFTSLRGIEFDIPVTWSETDAPKSIHPLHDPLQIDALKIPDPSGGLNAKKIAWYHAMQAAVGDFDVRLNGQPLTLNASVRHGGGPIPAAFALAGENLFLWMATEPERVHRLMHIVTESHLNCTRLFDDLAGRDHSHSVWLGADAGELIGPDMYREFVVPYYQRIWSVYKGPRPFHNCGKNEHLLDIIRDDLGITTHDGFGFCVDPEILAAKMAGRVRLQGGFHPLLIKNGPYDTIVAEAKRYILTLGMRGGFILSSGGSLAPDTPTGNVRALVDASAALGCVMT